MSQTFRHPEILEIARRDLSELADAGRLERVHGGATGRADPETGRGAR